MLKAGKESALRSNAVLKTTVDQLESDLLAANTKLQAAKLLSAVSGGSNTHTTLCVPVLATQFAHLSLKTIKLKTIIITNDRRLVCVPPEADVRD